MKIREGQMISLGAMRVFVPLYSQENVETILAEILQHGQWILHDNLDVGINIRVCLKRPYHCGCLIFRAPVACGGFHGGCKPHRCSNPYFELDVIPSHETVKEDIENTIALILVDPSVLIRMYTNYIIQDKPCIHFYPQERSIV